MAVVIGVMMGLAFIGGCTWINSRVGLDDDNVIEEGFEDFIQQEVGISIDLSPQSPENYE